MRAIRPFAYTSTTRYHHTNKAVVRRVMILNPFQRREEFPDGLVRIFDHSQKPVGMLQLNAQTKQALWQSYPDHEPKEINQDILATLLGFAENPDLYRIEDRGLHQMGERTTKCFQVAVTNSLYTVWADLRTRYPVRVELEQPEYGRTFIWTEFDFVPQFDAHLFSRIPPQGYTLVERTKEVGEPSAKPTQAFRSRIYTGMTKGADGSIKKRCRYYEPSIDRCRREYEGQHEVYDYSRKPARILMLDIKKKKAALETYPGEKRTRINTDFLAILRNAQAEPEIYKVEDRGEQVIEGRATHCLHIPGQYDTVMCTFWIDAETGLPVRIEQKRGDITRIWMEFQFDVEIDPSLLELRPPEGYAVTEVDYPAADPGKPTETHLIKGLEVIAKLIGGRFPRALGWGAIQQQMRTYVQENNIDLSPELIKDLRVAIEPFNAFVGRLKSSPKSFDLNYAGQGQRLGDTEAVILWYRPEGKTNYHRVYGDLRVEEVSPEDLSR